MTSGIFRIPGERRIFDMSPTVCFRMLGGHMSTCATHTFSREKGPPCTHYGHREGHNLCDDEYQRILECERHSKVLPGHAENTHVGTDNDKRVIGDCALCK
jgi:hypothetical protein